MIIGGGQRGQTTADNRRKNTSEDVKKDRIRGEQRKSRSGGNRETEQ